MPPVAAKPFGVAAAVPVLVHRSNRDGSRFGNPERARYWRHDRSGSRTAPAGWRARRSRASRSGAAAGSATLRVRCIPGRTRSSRASFASRVPTMRAWRRGRCRRTVIGRQLQLLGETHADQAAARGVSQRLPLGEIEGVGHRGEDRKKLDRAHEGKPAVLITRRACSRWRRSCATISAKADPSGRRSHDTTGEATRARDRSSPLAWRSRSTYCTW
jgi:hypothetical protein